MIQSIPDPWNIIPNIKKKFPDNFKESKLITWNYLPTGNGADIGGNAIMHKLSFDTPFMLSQLQANGIRVPAFHKMMPLIEPLPDALNENLLISFAAGTQVRVLKKEQVKPLLTYLSNFSTIPTKIAYVAGLDYEPVRFELMGFFNKDYSPLFLGMVAHENMFGHQETLVGFIIPAEHKFIDYTFQKLSPLLRSLKFNGIISLRVHLNPGNNELITENLTVYPNDLSLYAMLGYLCQDGSDSLDSFFNLLTHPTHTFLKEETVVHNPHNFVQVCRITMPPYPLLQSHWIGEEASHNLSLINKYIVIPDPQPRDVYWEEVIFHEGGVETVGPNVGATVTLSQEFTQDDPVLLFKSIPECQTYMTLLNRIHWMEVNSVLTLIQKEV